MIRIGLDSSQKQQEVDRYLASHQEIKRLIVFSFKRFPLMLQVSDSIAVEYVEYAQIIEYEYFYPLLEVIDPDTLLVFNECLRTQNRSDLTYNCAHHYANQTRHVIVFEYFPFIEQESDFMILLDYQTPGKYKGRSFDASFLRDEDVSSILHLLTLQVTDCPVSKKDAERYAQQKRKLFDSLGHRDPDTIPRQLHLFTGNLKKSVIDIDRWYVARNDRLKMPNVKTYQDIAEAGEYAVIDFPHRRIDFNDFLKVTKMHEVCFVTTHLKVDSYYLHELEEWNKRLERFCAQTGLYK